MRPELLQIVRHGGAVPGLVGAAAGQTRRDALLVRLGDAGGCTGQGEASPLPGYSPDTLAECAAQLQAVNLGLLPSLDDNGPIGAGLAPALDDLGLTAPAARFAFETALLDWLGQRRGQSVAVLLGGAAAASRRVPLSALVADLAAAHAAHARGIRAFKLKVSPATLAADLRLAQSLREAFGTAVALRLDGNGRFAPTAAHELLRRLAPLAPEFVEEPLAWPALAALSDSPVPLAADESLAVAGAWPALAGVCRVLVLKPTLLGGLGACLALARDAAARGLATLVTHTFDGPVALAAAGELAAVLPGDVRACGLDRHSGLQAWPALGVPQLHDDAVASANRPGLGLAPVPGR
ncbi:MAG: O-succinylbenzoate synthase [Leptothrix sp. (in: Bacteria)]|nr:O-succinylbenzoate synthase [Leptothrix sp. (in: b-proteobacteria)]